MDNGWTFLYNKRNYFLMVNYVYQISELRITQILIAKMNIEK